MQRSNELLNFAATSPAGVVASNELLFSQQRLPVGDVASNELLGIFKDQMNNYWEADEKTHELLQYLKQFVIFVANLKYGTQEDKKNANQILELITTIDQPLTFKSWNVCLDLFDRKIQDGLNKQGGIYWRQWSVWFAREYLEIVAKTSHSEEPVHHYGDDFSFNAYISFEPDFSENRLSNPKGIKAFVADAMQYKQYVSDSLNDIEIEIYVGA